MMIKIVIKIGIGLTLFSWFYYRGLGRECQEAIGLNDMYRFFGDLGDF